MKFLNNKAIIFTIIMFFVPVLIKSHNLKLTYQINSTKKELKKLETENQYLKKSLYSLSSLPKIRKQAFNLGFKIAEPYTIVIIDGSLNQTKEKKETFFARISKSVTKQDNI